MLLALGRVTGHCFSVSQVSTLDFITLLNSFFTWINKPSNCGTATTRDKRANGRPREIYFHHIKRTHSTPCLCRPNNGTVLGWIIMNSEFLPQEFSDIDILTLGWSECYMANGLLSLCPVFKHRNSSLFCFNKRRVKSKSWCLPHSD